MKLLELKGRDRDKLIALKRGYTLDNCGSAGIFVNERYTWLGRDLSWTEKRNDAWELWDELPSPKSYHVFESGKHEITLDFYDKEGEPTEHYLYSEGTSFADAVSKAWLKWYYNTQWLKKFKCNSKTCRDIEFGGEGLCDTCPKPQIIPDDMIPMT